MLTAQNRDSMQAENVLCSPQGALCVTTGPAEVAVFTDNGSVDDSDLYLLGILLRGGSTTGAVLIEANGLEILSASAASGGTTYIALPAPLRCITEDGLVVTVQGTGTKVYVYYYSS